MWQGGASVDRLSHKCVIGLGFGAAHCQAPWAISKVLSGNNKVLGGFPAELGILLFTSPVSVYGSAL